MLDVVLHNIKVFLSAGGVRTANYVIKPGQEYKQDQKNSTKGYNKDAIFRQEVTDVVLLARKF